MIYIEHVPRGGGLGVKLDNNNKKKVVKKGKKLRFTNFRAKI